MSPMPKVGAIAAVRSLRGSEIFGVEMLGTVALGVGGGTVVLANTTVTQRVDIAGDALSVAAPMLGMVFAGFALVVALFSDDYLRLLAATEGGVLGFVHPFVLATAIHVIAVMSAIAYRASASWLDSRVEVAGWLTVCAAVVLAMLEVMALSRSIAMHVWSRARAVELLDSISAAKDGQVVDHPRKHHNG